MGNRLRGFQGVLQLAIVTERALLVDWYGGVIGRSRLYHKFEGKVGCNEERSRPEINPLK